MVNGQRSDRNDRDNRPKGRRDDRRDAGPRGGRRRGGAHKKPKSGAPNHQGGGDEAKKQPKRVPEKREAPEPPFRHVLRRYGVVFYDSMQAAKSDLEKLRDHVKEYDQLNIVIRADGDMDDPELLALGSVKVFAGAAWTLIHERRKEEGWYDSPR